MSDAAIRLAFFAVIFFGLAIAEVLRPWRRLTHFGRRPANLVIAALNSFLVAVIFPFGVVGVAEECQSRGWGIFSFFSFPDWLAVILGVLVLDLIIYGQHVVFHKIDWLWRFHRLHHSDLELDVTTGLRFHPIEIALSLMIKVAAVAVVGISPWSVTIFEILLNGMAMFNHSNIAMPSWLDRKLRLVLVTPDMHRIHHSWRGDEMSLNFGFHLSWWDSIFGTFRSNFEATSQVTFGLKSFRSENSQRLTTLLRQPFLDD